MIRYGKDYFIFCVQMEQIGCGLPVTDEKELRKKNIGQLKTQLSQLKKDRVRKNLRGKI